LIGGISYEFIRLADKKINNPFFKLFILPGLWLQKITTREPDDDQLEVALVALQCALGIESPGLVSDIQIYDENLMLSPKEV
jgi:uncharacterized protein YqhQ